MIGLQERTDFVSPIFVPVFRVSGRLYVDNCQIMAPFHPIFWSSEDRGTMLIFSNLVYKTQGFFRAKFRQKKGASYTRQNYGSLAKAKILTNWLEAYSF